MTKNAKAVSIVILAGIVLVIVVLVGRDVWLRRSEPLDCGDGVRHKIDIREFSTQYAAYSLDLEGSITNKASLSTKLSPIQLQQLSEATQNAQEFRKYVVAGFNSCAITKAQYGQLGPRFQALDSLAKEIDGLTKHPTVSPDEQTRLTTLTVQYGDLVRKLGSD